MKRTAQFALLASLALLALGAAATPAAASDQIRDDSLERTDFTLDGVTVAELDSGGGGSDDDGGGSGGELRASLDGFMFELSAGGGDDDDDSDGGGCCLAR